MAQKVGDGIKTGASNDEVYEYGLFYSDILIIAAQKVASGVKTGTQRPRASA